MAEMPICNARAFASLGPCCLSRCKIASRLGTRRDLLRAARRFVMRENLGEICFKSQPRRPVFCKDNALGSVMLATGLRRDGRRVGGGCGPKRWVCSGEPIGKT